jgi:small subunit ribosomal protein S17
MAEEEDKTEETETEVADAPAPEAAEAPDAGAAGAAGETPAAEAEPAAQAAPAAEAAPPAEEVPPKERRRRARVAKAAKSEPRRPLTPEERQAERVTERGRKAVRRRVERERARTKARAAHATGQTTPARERVPGVQKTRQGVVVSDRADKTITVRIDVTRRHRRYEKIVRTSNTLHAHDERNDAHIGDTVIVRESRPLSRTKRWRLVEVVERAK